MWQVLKKLNSKSNKNGKDTPKYLPKRNENIYVDILIHSWSKQHH